jgi:hypothetical protein
MTTALLRRRLHRASTLGLIVLGGWIGQPCRAHADSEARIEVRIGAGRISGSWRGTLRDLDHALGLDADRDGRLTRAEWEKGSTRTGRWVLEHLRVSMKGRTIQLEPGEWSFPSTSNGQGARLPFSASLPVPLPHLVLEYDGFFDADPWHRGHVSWTWPDGSTLHVVLGPGRTRWSPREESGAPDLREAAVSAAGRPALAGAVAIVVLLATRAMRRRLRPRGGGGAAA